MPRLRGPGASIILATILLALAAAWGCDAPTAGQDGGPDGRMDAGRDAGSEPRRDGGATDAGPPDAGDPCDMDGDGRDSVACGGEDCDDENGDRFPGNSEACDDGDIDEDCNPATLGALDADGDGVVSSACCNLGLDEVLRCGLDCDDGSTATYTDAPELCDGHDNDCDGMVDEDVMLPFYADADGDGFGAISSTPAMACAQPAGHSVNQTDCRDDDAAIHPAAVEACDLIDNNCDGHIDPGCDCTIGAPPMDCDLTACTPGTSVCIDGHWGPCVGSVPPSTTCYPDVDGDGYARAGAVGVLGCSACADRGAFTGRPPTGSNIDCNDNRTDVYPLATEVCDAVDHDCDGNPYNGMICTPGMTRGCGGTCFGTALGVQTCQPTGLACGWGECRLLGDTTCNAYDDDCDGELDEDFPRTGCRSRLYRRQRGTTPTNSRDLLITNSRTEGGSGWTGPTGIGGTMFVYPSSSSGFEPIQRCVHNTRGTHFFRLHTSCPSGWTNEGVLGYAASPTTIELSIALGQPRKFTPVFVLQDQHDAWYFTSSVAEFNAARNAPSANGGRWSHPSTAEQATWGIECTWWNGIAADGGNVWGCVIMGVWTTEP